MNTMCPDDIAIADWALQIQQALVSCLHQAQYGNLRAEFRRWANAEGVVANLAIVYEVPGGSTDQFNVTYDESSGVFTYLTLEACVERHTGSCAEVIDAVSELVRQIPSFRRARLREEIDRWVAAGVSRPALFRQLTLLLEVDGLRGGAITPEEMNDGLDYIILRDHFPAG